MHFDIKLVPFISQKDNNSGDMGALNHKAPKYVSTNMISMCKNFLHFMWL